MSPELSDRLSSAALARRWAAWTRYASHGKSPQEVYVASIEADTLEKFARVLETGEHIPMLLDDDDTPTAPPPVLEDK